MSEPLRSCDKFDCNIACDFAPSQAHLSLYVHHSPSSPSSIKGYHCSLVSIICKSVANRSIVRGRLASTMAPINAVATVATLPRNYGAPSMPSRKKTRDHWDCTPRPPLRRATQEELCLPKLALPQMQQSADASVMLSQLRVGADPMPMK